MYKLSVIICTHNPRLEYLDRVFQTLKNQTLSVANWELLLIDNNSNTLLSKVVDLSWHPHSRHILETETGLTPSRIKGIIEAKSDILIFIDDDNCLNTHYLQIVLDNFENNNLIGVLGAGIIKPEYEIQPSEEVLPFTNMLALRNDVKAHYSNTINFSKAIPYGAGMAIYRSIALKYIESCRDRTFAAKLDRVGNALLSGGDIDMALHACREGYIAGVIPDLQIVHLIPKSRLSIDYLVKIAAGHAFSHYVLGKLWDYNPDYAENTILKKLRYWNKVVKSKGLYKRIFIAEYKATQEAKKVWNAHYFLR